jgi:hypothetical protein
MLRGKEQQSQKVGETALSRSSMYFPFNQSLFAKKTKKQISVRNNEKL